MGRRRMLQATVGLLLLVTMAGCSGAGKKADTPAASKCAVAKDVTPSSISASMTDSEIAATVSKAPAEIRADVKTVIEVARRARAIRPSVDTQKELTGLFDQGYKDASNRITAYVAAQCGGTRTTTAPVVRP